MNIEAIPTGAFEEICYIVWGNTKQAIIFDPGDDAEIILKTLNQNKLRVSAYVCTHGHADHINALADLYQHHPAPTTIHSKDLSWAFSALNQIEPYYTVPKQPEIETYLHLESKEKWSFGDLEFNCIETPGHTPGSCCFLFPNNKILITGDTLFKGSCGRTDLPGGDPRKLKESLAKLKKLPAEVRVYPGHGSETTIGLERETNFFMQ